MISTSICCCLPTGGFHNKMSCSVVRACVRAYVVDVVNKQKGERRSAGGESCASVIREQ
jgi:hypothetical protein